MDDVTAPNPIPPELREPSGAPPPRQGAPARGGAPETQSADEAWAQAGPLGAPVFVSGTWQRVYLALCLLGVAVSLSLAGRSFVLALPAFAFAGAMGWATKRSRAEPLMSDGGEYFELRSGVIQSAARIPKGDVQAVHRGEGDSLLIVVAGRPHPVRVPTSLMSEGERNRVRAALVGAA